MCKSDDCRSAETRFVYVCMQVHVPGAPFHWTAGCLKGKELIFQQTDRWWMENEGHMSKCCLTWLLRDLRTFEGRKKDRVQL